MNNWHITKNGAVKLNGHTLGTCEEIERNVQAYALLPVWMRAEVSERAWAGRR